MSDIEDMLSVTEAKVDTERALARLRARVEGERIAPVTRGGSAPRRREHLAPWPRGRGDGRARRDAAHRERRRRDDPHDLRAEAARRGPDHGHRPERRGQLRRLWHADLDRAAEA